MNSMNPQDTIVKFYRSRISRQVKVTFFSTFLIGLLTHAFVLTNVIHNYDNIRCTPMGAGSGATSGRWVITLIHKVWHKVWGVYNLTFFNGIISLLFIILSACVVVEIYQIKNILNCILIGGILVTFPAVTSLFFFTFTAPYYSMAIFLSVLAVFFYKKGKYGFIISLLCIAFAMGTYQAYLPLTIALFVLLLLEECIQKQWKIIETFTNGIKMLAVLIGGAAAYFGVLKVFLWHYDIELNSYQGIDSMGKIDIREIPTLIMRCLKNCLLLFRRDYSSISSTAVIRAGVLSLMACTLIFVILNLYMRHAGMQNIISVIVLCIFLVIASDSIEIMCPNSAIYSLMTYGVVVLFCTPIILCEICPDLLTGFREKFLNIWQWIVTVTVMVMVLNYAWQANGNYMSSYYTTQQTVAYFETLITRIKSVEGYSDQYPVAFIGEDYEDESFSNNWRTTPFWYGGHTLTLLNNYSRDWFLRNYLGYTYTPVSDEIQKTLEEQTVDMPSYPDDGSIKVIDGVVVVKRCAAK